ncbi:MAG: type I-U CRISPR-associated helicase/endonuclease Cas3 [Desulfopila sp.]
MISANADTSPKAPPTISFADFFRTVTGHQPFPWQARLFATFATGRFPTNASIPTGLGKTSVVAIWLFALAMHPENVPRRLVYVVNRRTVVDQTTAEVENLRTALAKEPMLTEVSNQLRQLCALPLPSPDAPPLAISTLRGQFVDNLEWSVDPARPAVIIGTVDMIGSGLLFSRYTVGFRLRPHHAAFLAQDALLIHDEAHLEPAFQHLLETIVAEQARCNDPRKLQVIELTATTRTASVGESFGISQEDRKNDFVKKRLNAVKKLILRPVDEKEKVCDVITKTAEAFILGESERAVLIFVRTVEDVTKIATVLKKKAGEDKVLTLTGTMRGRERDKLVTHPLFRRFLPMGGHKPEVTGTVFLVATSAGEVGVNISADELICDISTFESMAQRFGRVNRFGQRDDSTITVVVPSEFSHSKKLKEREEAVAAGKKGAEKKLRETTDKEALGIARERTLALLLNLDGDASPAALERLPSRERALAFSPPPRMRVATALQFDAWALTSIRKPIAARPPIAPYLHGEAEWQPAETSVAWREELDVIRDEVLTAVYRPKDLLDDFPLKPHELLRDTSTRIARMLSARIEAFWHESPQKKTPEDIPCAWLVKEDGAIQILRLVESTDLITAYRKKKNRNPRQKELLKKHEDDLAISLTNTTLILPASLGGIDSEQGLFIADAKSGNNATDVSAIKNSRLRCYSPSVTLPEEYASSYRLVRAIDTEIGKEEPTSSPTRYWLWLEARKSVNGRKRSAAQPETLAAHTAATVANTAAIAGKLFPATPAAGEPHISKCLCAAGQGHDKGKDRHSWQQGIGNSGYDPGKPETILAKSGDSARTRHLAAKYRHEFGSINTITAANLSDRKEDILAPFSAIERDSILHLIAAHHGRARPHFSGDEVLDYTLSPEVGAQVAMEVPLRFARMQRRFGRWGLTWLESFLRAADYAASAGIVADHAATTPPRHRCLPQSLSSIDRVEKKTFSLRVDVANPGQYFACCGLFELTACLAPDVLTHFEQDASKQWWFVVTLEQGDNQEFTLYAVLEAFAAAELTTAVTRSATHEDNDEGDEDDASDSDDGSMESKAPPLKLGPPFDLRLDWWETATSQTAALKVWAGSMDCLRIARAMKDAVGEIILQRDYPTKEADILFASRVVYEHKTGKPKKVEPFYFDAKRGPNADSRDVGFSPNTLQLETIAAPTVEILCLVGLQRAIPIPAEQPRHFSYHLWTRPLPIALLAAALNGQLPDSSSHSYRFESWFRTSQKKHKAFLAAQPLVHG